MDATPDCAFCAIVAGRAGATVLREWPDALAIEPLGDVTDGHAVVIPRRHVDNAVDDADVTAATMRQAAELGVELSADLRLMVSVGPAATQTRHHLHIYLLPRAEAEGDGPALLGAEDARDGRRVADTEQAYVVHRERARQLTWLSGMVPRVIASAADLQEPGWLLVDLDTAEGQFSWYINPRGRIMEEEAGQ